MLDDVAAALWILAYGDEESAVAARGALRDQDIEAVDRIPEYLTLGMSARAHKLGKALRRRPGKPNVPAEIRAAVRFADAWAEEAGY